MPIWFPYTRILWAPTIVYASLALVAVGIVNRMLSELQVCLSVIVGFMIWTLFEYLVHRFLNHPPPSRAWLDFDNHHYHHKEPENPCEFVYKLKHSLAASFCVLGVWCFLAPTWAYGLAIMGGFWIGYICYEWVHLFTHLPSPYRTSWIKRLSALHHRHHYEGIRGCYGFITSIWDRIFRTYLQQYVSNALDLFNLPSGTT